MSANEPEYVCRGCLAESGEMKNMYEWNLSDDFYRISSIASKNSAGMPELLCVSCELTLNTCKEFQLLCQRSDMVLRMKIKAEKEEQNKPNNEITSIFQDTSLLIQITAPDQEEKINLPCPYLCSNEFIKKKDLFSHLRNIHNISKDFTIDLHYHCAVQNCVYHKASDKNKYFSGRKHLNQHINKVHKEKIFSCNECSEKFSTESIFFRHKKTCKMAYVCQLCDISYSCNEALMVHLLRKHPKIHKRYIDTKKQEKITKRLKTECAEVQLNNSLPLWQEAETKNNIDFIDSPKKSFATQIPEDIKNDVTLPSWTKTDEISTQTVFSDLLSLKSQNSEDEYFSETVSLSDIQTQTFPIEFGLSRLNKETQFRVHSETQSPDLSIKETQTCICHYDSLKPKLFDSLSSSPANLTSSETQTGDKFALKSDVMLSFNSAETQTCFDESSNDSM